MVERSRMGDYIEAVPDAACRISAGNDGRTIDWPAAVISLRSEDVIVTPLLPAMRDGRTSAAIAIGAV